MTEILKNTLQEFLTEALSYVNKVGKVFEDYFGEDRVELFIPYYYNSAGSDTVPQFIKEFIQFHAEDGEDVDSEDEIAIIELLHRCFLDLEEEDRKDALLSFMVHFRIPESNITVYFPEVVITNENGNFTKIKNLFARIEVTITGELVRSFKLLRSHYTYAHFKNNYMHSHVDRIPLEDPTVFQGCCTGSGPINDTIERLHGGFDETQWMQFCWDLDKYVQVESLSGIPYHKLIDADCEDSAETLIETYCYYTPYLVSEIGNTTLYKDFIKYIVESGKIRFRWAHNNWELAHSFSEFTCIISKLFLQWAKEASGYITTYGSINSFLNSVTTRVIYRGTNLYMSGTERYGRDVLSNIDTFVGKEIVNFKGESFLGEVDAPINKEGNLRVLYPSSIKAIKNILLKIINIYYGRKSTEVLSQE